MTVMTQQGEILISVMTETATRNDYVWIVYINNKTFIFGFSNEKIMIYVWNYIFLTYMLYFILIT